MQTLGRHDMRPDQNEQRRQRGRAGADPIRQRGDLEVDAFTRVSLALAVQREMVRELRIQDHRQQVRPGTATRDRMERRRRLSDGLTGTAGELLPHRLDHLPLARDDLQRLGDGLTQPGQGTATAWACCWARKHHPLARQMRR